jgi:hypothetical protein
MTGFWDFAKDLINFRIEGFGSFLVVIALLWIGFYFVYSGRLQQKPLSDYALQIVGLTLFAPLLLILTIGDKIQSEAVTGLFGTIVGYIFGVATKQEPKEVTSSANAQTTDTQNVQGASRENARGSAG